MSEFKGTPGPWSWYQPASSAATNPHSAVFVLGPKRVPMDKQQGFTIADARLIAAAPDLLEALKGLLDNEHRSAFEHWLSAECPSGDCDSVQAQWLESSEYSDFADLYSDELNAIARATGEQE